MIGLMLSGVFGLFALVAFNIPPSLMAETSCRMDRKDPAHTVILLDQSDPFNPNDLDWVHEFVDNEARALPKYGRLTVMTPNAADPFQPKVIFVKCSPGSIADANPITQNPKMIESAWQKTFYQPLIAEIEHALQDTRQPSSPLFEALYTISDRADFQASSENRRVVVVSDLMQHSDAFSFYKVGADYDAYLDSKLAGTKPNMDHVQVVARIVPRQIYDLPIADVKAFWRAYFTDAGAEFGSVN
ncbi:hypothetical protein HJO_01130 [Hyphomonas johnsonii MHS-2]|uniref:Uncharacterized protein n=2 Tax=Hyphomonas johnsonii TaxID=81031 RepID=A0A059FTD2_9PROT|nr:hypothetical protein HJO_01130 [Hyphomonas johnsonii MHS-2]